MNKKKLHICLKGQHFGCSYDNILNLYDRVYEDLPSFLDISFNIVYCENNFEGSPSSKEQEILLERLKDTGRNINGISFVSKFFENGGRFKRCTPSVNVILSEYNNCFLNSTCVGDEDYVLFCRSDYYLTDEFLSMIKTKQFFEKLEQPSEKRIFRSKIWLPLIGKERFLDFCDYHFLGKSIDIKKTLILDYSEALSLWRDKNLCQDYKMFVEKLEFLKPIIADIEKKKCFLVNEDYWDLINDNFCFGGYATDNVATVSFSWRNSAVGKGRSAIKCSIPMQENIKQKYYHIVEKYGKIRKSNIVFVRQSNVFGGFK